MKIVIDGVFFSLSDSGISRVWKSVLPHLLEFPELDITILDRGGVPPIDGLKRLPFPTYKDLYNADDSILLQKACDFLEADVFTSTYYTTPLSTPMFLLVHDMIPETLEFDLNDRHWQEKAIALSYARRFIAVSGNTKIDMIKHYPNIANDIDIALCGYDNFTFKPPKRSAIDGFRARFGLDRPYILMVGSREQHLGYKNSRIFFRALPALGEVDFDILCVGGEETIHPEALSLVPDGVTIQRVELTDTDLATAYSDAIALVYPSLYEGFGLPVIEAMACGCPVITTSHGSLGEVAGDAAWRISGYSITEMAEALRAVRAPETRERLISAGLRHSEDFSWTTLANGMRDAIGETAKFNSDRRFADFVAQWGRLRTIQSEVDVLTWHA